MTETNETAEGSGGAQESAAGGQETHGVVQDDAGGDEGELRAEEESAKAMEAEVPHPAGYPDAEQEPPA
ncbi:MAG TPA: hypothetical protein VJ866_04275 [Pyrinomonadaceae bacterium]|nr:hypothetical protein [Pyrinomonadaceae bacterium]